MTDFSFALPHVLWAAAVLPVLMAFFFIAERQRRKALSAFLALRLHSRLAATVSPAKRRWSFILLLLSLLLGLIAAAQPRWGFTWEERADKGRDIIIAIDTSRSMLAQDLKPNRLARAKLAAQDILTMLEGDRVGLVAFAGTAFLQAPLTADFDAVRNALAELDTEIIPQGGTNLTAAIENAADAFGKGESDARAMIIFTDGEELEADAVEAAKSAGEKFKIFTVGLGSPEGALIPLRNERGGTDFVRDSNDEYVKSRLDEARLRAIADAGKGFYVHLQSGPGEMQRIVNEGLGKMKEREAESRFTKQPIERYQWPLAGAVLCALAALLLGDRRRLSRKPAGAAAALLLFLPISNAEAVMPHTDFNRGCEAFDKGDYGAAAEAFSQALGTAPSALQGKAAYNLANTLARRGAAHKEKADKLSDWKNAVQHYDRTLALHPDDADAKHNRDLVQKLIAELEKPEDKQQQQQDSQEKKDKDEKEEKQDGDKNESSQGGKDQQKQSSDGGKEESKDQQSKDSQAGKQDSQEQGKDSEKGKEQKSGGEKQEKQGDQEGQQSKPGEKGQKDSPPKDVPQPKEGEERKEGELKAANQGEKASGEPQDGPEGDAAAEAAAAAQGTMTEKQAKALLQAIKDERVRLLDPRDATRRVPPRQFKDW